MSFLFILSRHIILDFEQQAIPACHNGPGNRGGEYFLLTILVLFDQANLLLDNTNYYLSFTSSKTPYSAPHGRKRVWCCILSILFNLFKLFAVRDCPGDLDRRTRCWEGRVRAC
jgi:hypothetical protein